jgi:hypothetical protein
MKKVLGILAVSLMMVSGGAFACDGNDCGGTVVTPTKSTSIYGSAGIKVQGGAMAIGDIAKTFSAGQYTMNHGFAFDSTTTGTNGNMNLQGGYLAESAGPGESYAAGKAYSVGSYGSSFSVPTWNTGN